MRNSCAMVTTRPVNLRIVLCTGVSILAITVMVPEVRAADVDPLHVYKAPPPTPTGQWTTWVEGGAFLTKDPVFFAIPAGADAFLFTGFSISTGTGTGSGANVFPGLRPGGIEPRVGWEGAFGLDYKFAGTPWHASFEARYGAAKAADQTTTLRSTGTPPPTLWIANSTLGEKEDHAVLDFMLGREMSPTYQFKLGVRVADLGARLTDFLNASGSTGPGCSPTSTATGTASCSLVTTGMLSADERSTFIGAGPRVAVEGALPFSPSWAFQYGAGAALLIGESQLSIESAAQNTCISTGTGTVSSICFTRGFVGLATVPTTSPSSRVSAAFNANALAALAYSFNANCVLSVGFRFDGYWNALRTVNSAGVTTNVDRLYYGPFARLSVRF